MINFMKNIINSNNISDSCFMDYTEIPRRCGRGTWTPEDVERDPNLNSTDKLIFSALLNLSKTGSCYASNRYLGRRFCLSESQARRTITKLKKLKYIDVSIGFNNSRNINILKDYSKKSNSIEGKILGDTQENVLDEILEEEETFKIDKANILYIPKDDEKYSAQECNGGAQKRQGVTQKRQGGAQIRSSEIQSSPTAPKDTCHVNNSINNNINNNINKHTCIKTKNNDECKNSNNILQMNNELFNKFWEAYPKHISKVNALRVWNKLKPDLDLTNKIIDSVERFKKTFSWNKNNGQFIPYPTSFLINERWNDEIEVNIQPDKYNKQFNYTNSSSNNQYNKFSSGTEYKNFEHRNYDDDFFEQFYTAL